MSALVSTVAMLGIFFTSVGIVTLGNVAATGTGLPPKAGRRTGDTLSFLSGVAPLAAVAAG